MCLNFLLLLLSSLCVLPDKKEPTGGQMSWVGVCGPQYACQKALLGFEQNSGFFDLEYGILSVAQFMGKTLDYLEANNNRVE